jgi:site-specific DNA recombinase
MVEKGKRMCRPASKETVITYEGAHEAIIDIETFEKVQKKLEANSTKRDKRNHKKYPLSGLVRCHKCGKIHTFYIRSDRHVKEGAYSMKPCLTEDLITGEKCGNSSCKPQLIEDHLKDKIWHEVRPAFHKINKDTAKAGKDLNLIDSHKELRLLEKQKQEFNKMINNIFELQIVRGVDDLLLEKEQQIKKQLESVNDQIEHLKNNNVDLTDWVDTFMKLNEELDSFVHQYTTGDNPTKNRLFKKYIEHVNYCSDPFSLEIVYKPDIEKILAIVKDKK